MEKSTMTMIAIAVILHALLACQAAELKRDASQEQETAAKKQDDLSWDKGANGPLMPLWILRKRDNPDFFLYFLQFYEPFIPQQVMDMIDSQVRPQTEQMTGQIMDNVPGAEQAWAQLSQIQNILNQFQLSSLMGGFGGGGSSGGSSSSSSGGGSGGSSGSSSGSDSSSGGSSSSSSQGNSGRGRGDSSLAALLQQDMSQRN